VKRIDFGLGETADMLRDSVRSFASDRIAPRADEIDRSNIFPRDLWPELGKLGVHGITVEEEWGGSGHYSPLQEGNEKYDKLQLAAWSGRNE
jgi:isovaleryl-CoA dehydrogenase